MPIIIDEGVLDAALAIAATVGTIGGPAVAGLKSSVLDPDQSVWIARLWNTAEGAVRLSWEKGKAAADALLEKFREQLLDLGKAIGDAAAAVRRIIAQRLNRFFTSLVENALERFQPDIEVAGRKIVLRGVTIEQTLKMSASLKASLEEMCEFVAEGEIAVSAEYGPE